MRKATLPPECRSNPIRNPYKSQKMTETEEEPQGEFRLKCGKLNKMENPTEELQKNPTVRLKENPSSDGRSTWLADLAALLAAQCAKH